MRFVKPLMIATLVLGTACTCGSGPYQGDFIDEDLPPSIETVHFKESKKGDPALVGCADGQREGFASLEKFPRVAGCIGTWDKHLDLRAEPTQTPCGDDLAGTKCKVPGDVCAEGWHVCGRTGLAPDLRSYLSATECKTGAGPGRFNAALSHSPNDQIQPCPITSDRTHFPCMADGLGAEPVCCGGGCLFGLCKDGVWKGKTYISRGTSEGCGSVSADRNGGVMCCYSGEGTPSDDNAAADNGAVVDEASGGSGDGENSPADEEQAKAEESAGEGEQAKTEESAGGDDDQAKAEESAGGDDDQAEAEEPADDGEQAKAEESANGDDAESDNAEGEAEPAAEG